MKKLLFALLATSLIFVISCGDDEDAPVPGLTGTVNFNGQSYTIANGIFDLAVDDGNAVGTFFLSDGTIESDGSGGVNASGSGIVISVVAVAVGQSALTEGSYATSTNVPDLYADVQVNIIADGGISTSDAFTNGQVVISGSGNTYSLTFTDIPFGQGVTLTGSVSGTYAN